MVKAAKSRLLVIFKASSILLANLVLQNLPSSAHRKLVFYNHLAGALEPTNLRFAVRNQLLFSDCLTFLWLHHCRYNLPKLLVGDANHSAQGNWGE